MYCGKCGAEVKPGIQFCGKCGQPVVNEQRGIDKISDVAKTTGVGVSRLLQVIPRRVLIVAAVLVVCVIALICVLANRRIDPFEGVEIRFSGIAPIGYADIMGSPKYSHIAYDMDETNGLSNGDTIKLRAYVTGISEEEFEKEYGKLPSKMEKEYTPLGLEEASSRPISAKPLINPKNLQQQQSITD